MAICPRCGSENILVVADDPAPYVRCGDCHNQFIPSIGPLSHETLKKINERLERIERMVKKILRGEVTNAED